MFVSPINNKNQLNTFISAQPHSEFSQSFEWGEYQESLGNRIFRLGVEDESGLKAAITFIKVSLPFDLSYFYAPRGPIFNFQFSIFNFQAILNFLKEEIKKIAKNEKCIFLRFEPDASFKLQALSFKLNKTIDVQPHRTTILDLSKSEEEQLSAMHQKTRYNIRLAEKKGIEIIEAGVERFEDFWKLMEETKNRDGFRLHSKEHYQKQISNFQFLISNSNHKSLSIKLFLAEYEGKVIAGNIISFFGDTVTYMHGASADNYRNLMAPYLLHWHIIKQAKSLGYKFYDLYGIDEIKWPGVTRFKLGFGGEEKTYPGTFDLVFETKWYNIYRLIRKIRRMV